MKSIVALVSLAGCVFSGKQGGEACRADRECSEGSCYGGICSGESCNGQDADCPTHFKCLHDDGDPIFGTGAGYYCVRSCDGGCPERWECSQHDHTCYFLGPEVTVTADVAMPVAGQQVTFTAAMSPDLEGTFAWRFEDSIGNAVGTTAMGATCKQAFDAGDYTVLVDWRTSGYGDTASIGLHVRE